MVGCRGFGGKLSRSEALASCPTSRPSLRVSNRFLVGSAQSVAAAIEYYEASHRTDGFQDRFHLFLAEFYAKS